MLLQLHVKNQKNSMPIFHKTQKLSFWEDIEPFWSKNPKMRLFSKKCSSDILTLCKKKSENFDKQFWRNSQQHDTWTNTQNSKTDKQIFHQTFFSWV